MLAFLGILPRSHRMIVSHLETIQINRGQTLNERAPTVSSTRWSITRSAVSTPEAFRSSAGPRGVTGADMQKLHLKVRNLPVRGLQMRLPGVSPPALPPLAPF